MAGRLFNTAFLAIFAIVLIGASIGTSQQTVVPLMSKEELKEKMDGPDIAVLDVRAEKDWLISDSKIKKSIREDPWKVEAWENKYPKDKLIVLYCA